MCRLTSLQRDDGWWKATCGKKTGLVPSNYGKGEREGGRRELERERERDNGSFDQNASVVVDVSILLSIYFMTMQKLFL